MPTNQIESLKRMAQTTETLPKDKVEQFEEYQPVPAVEQGNGAVLLDISHAGAQAGGTTLKLTSDGHVSDGP